MSVVGGLIEKGYGKDKSKSLILANGNEILTNHLADANIRSRILEWDAINGTCYHCDVKDKLEYYKLVKDINKIFKLTQHITFHDDPVDTHGIDSSLSELKQLYYFSDAEHITKLIKDFHLYLPLANAIRELFFEIKVIFEKTFEYMVDLRNRKYPKNTVDLPSFIKKWDLYDTKINNNTSSTLLCYYNNNDEFYSELRMQKNDNPEFHEALYSFIKASKFFKYLGFCPKVPCERFSRLLEFPYELLINCIKSIEPEYTPIDLKPFIRKLSNIHFSKAPNMSKKNIRKSPPKFAETVKGDKWLVNSHYAKWFVNQILEFYHEIRTKLHNWEQYYVDCAIETIALTKIIKKISKDYFKA